MYVCMYVYEFENNLIIKFNVFQLYVDKHLDY